MISVLCPTRGRPEGFAAMCASVYETALAFDSDFAPDVEVVAYLDEDDPSYAGYRDLELPWFVHLVSGERVVLSQAWNECSYFAKGEILMHCGDDIRFRTRGWNVTIEETFAGYPDRIAFVHGDDGHQHEQVGTHGFLHRRWVDAVGYFVPPYFVSDFNDMWLTEVADMIGRRVYLPKIETEHMHPDAGKGDVDLTHQERLARHSWERPDVLYVDLAHERAADAEKLRAAMQQ